MDRIETVVIGAGVVGLAVARELALSGQEVVVLESQDAFGTGTSSRNSEVIHAGIYYPAGSLKAQLCVRGRHLLYAYCQERQIPHRRCGKLIVATSSTQVEQLSQIQHKAILNGLTQEDALQLLSAKDAIAMEPSLYCEAALWSPSTGIIDSHALMLSYLGDFENAGGVLRKGQLLQFVWQIAFFKLDLPRAGSGWLGGSSHLGFGRSSQVWTRRGVGRFAPRLGG